MKFFQKIGTRSRALLFTLTAVLIGISGLLSGGRMDTRAAEESSEGKAAVFSYVANQNDNEIDVSINASSNPGIKSLSFSLSYDSKALSYSRTSWTSKLSNTDETSETNLDDAVALSFTSAQGYDADGVLATITFNNDSGIKPEDAKLNLSIDSVSYMDGSGTQVVGKGKSWGSDSTTAASKKASKNQPDKNYQTGQGIGTDIFLLIGAGAAAIAGVVFCLFRRKGK